MTNEFKEYVWNDITILVKYCPLFDDLSKLRTFTLKTIDIQQPIYLPAIIYDYSNSYKSK